MARACRTSPQAQAEAKPRCWLGRLPPADVIAAKRLS